MVAENWEKLKMLKLAELLQQESDEQHPLKTAQLCSMLGEIGIRCDRRTLATDIELLNKQGMDIKWKWVGKSKAFYIENKNLSVSELKILIDAVQAASFIPKELTEELIDKISTLAGSSRGSILKSNLVHFYIRKENAENIYTNVVVLEKAIQKRKKIVFCYYDTGIKGEKVYHNSRQRYEAEPLSLVFNEDNYYLLAYDEGDGAKYRVDRMDAIELSDERISEETMRMKSIVRRNRNQEFKMLEGPLLAVWLEFDSSLISAVYDHFGESIEMVSSEENKVMASVLVSLTPSFWGWLFQFGNKIKVIKPEEVNEEYKKRAEALLN